MYSLDAIGKSIAGMDDYQLIQRWKDGLFSDEAKPLAEDEFRRRGIDLADPVPRPSSFDVDLAPKPFKPKLLPILFAAIAGATVGRELGGALAGAIGAAFLSAVVALLGWYVGGAVARFAHKRKHLLIRVLICVAGLVAWLYLSGVGVVFARLMRGTLVK
ncbi:hypothetical protein LU699_08735 [Luteimonas fraxinea]|uniref:Uncharacterized protein n=1 Tax=Luteimonas fraxinea TaxID=2901869 RepID=A0ABS8UF87_9GAMM|nr:hypothetical protein [Luteimonas fraxinea]MCD9097517.1 hypothetical protein [Luteimonas fraxinea]UHH11767.1 hypothetical protein LU699_08735 [Luteimonas fraxinea]